MSAAFPSNLSDAALCGFWPDIRGYTAEQLGVGICSRTVRARRCPSISLKARSIAVLRLRLCSLVQRVHTGLRALLHSLSCSCCRTGCRADAKRGLANVVAFNGLGGGWAASLAPSRESVSRWDSRAKGNSPGTCAWLVLLRRMELSKRPVKKQVVEDFQSSGDEEGDVNQGWLGKKKSCKQGTDGRTGRARDSRNPSGRGSLLCTHHRHRIGLSRGNIHLADAEAHEQDQHRQLEVWHQRHKNQKNVRRQMRDHHRPNQPDPRCQPGSQESRNSGKDIRPEKNCAERCWPDAESQIEPIRGETLHHKPAGKRIQSKQARKL